MRPQEKQIPVSQSGKRISSSNCSRVVCTLFLLVAVLVLDSCWNYEDEAEEDLICPSANSMTRCACAATFASCVAMIASSVFDMEIFEQFNNFAAGVRIEVAGGFIGQKQFRLVDDARAMATRCCSPPESS